MVSELGHRHYANYINFFILLNKTFLVELKLEYSISDGIFRFIQVHDLTVIYQLTLLLIPCIKIQYKK